jgi:hypothetical protein
MTVEGLCPVLKPCICAAISDALRPASRGTAVSTAELAAWQPEQEDAPGGGSDAAKAQPLQTAIAATAMSERAALMAKFHDKEEESGGR